MSPFLRRHGRVRTHERQRGLAPVGAQPPAPRAALAKNGGEADQHGTAEASHSNAISRAGETAGSQAAEQFGWVRLRRLG